MTSETTRARKRTGNEIVLDPDLAQQGWSKIHLRQTEKELQEGKVELAREELQWGQLVLAQTEVQGLLETSSWRLKTIHLRSCSKKQKGMLMERHQN